MEIPTLQEQREVLNVILLHREGKTIALAIILLCVLQRKCKKQGII